MAEGEFGPAFCKGMGEEVPSETAASFLRHAILLREESRRFNLTALRDPEELARKLFFPSWKLGRLVDLRGKKVLDLGSGGGFPGIPLALSVPEASFLLCDSVRKKAGFLAAAVRELGLRNAEALWGRGEEILAKRRFDLVVTQGVREARSMLRGLSKVRGSFSRLVLMKGRSWPSEASAAEERGSGFRREGVLEYELPGSGEKRFLVVYRSVKADIIP